MAAARCRRPSSPSSCPTAFERLARSASMARSTTSAWTGATSARCWRRVPRIHRTQEPGRLGKAFRRNGNVLSVAARADIRLEARDRAAHQQLRHSGKPAAIAPMSGSTKAIAASTRSATRSLPPMPRSNLGDGGGCDPRLLEAGRDHLDPFGGSGTTLIAAERTGRKARLIELDPLYCDVTIRRWQSSPVRTRCIATGQTLPRRAKLMVRSMAVRAARDSELVGPTRRGGRVMANARSSPRRRPVAARPPGTAVPEGAVRQSWRPRPQGSGSRQTASNSGARHSVTDDRER